MRVICYVIIKVATGCYFLKSKPNVGDKLREIMAEN